jgi:hypothetical protein
MPVEGIEADPAAAVDLYEADQVFRVAATDVQDSASPLDVRSGNIEQ